MDRDADSLLNGARTGAVVALVLALTLAVAAAWTKAPGAYRSVASDAEVDAPSAWPPASSSPSPAPLPERLSDTGLFAAGRADAIDARALPFVPQYPLWSDGATKRRWIRLPEGAAIDARDPDAWQFPVGTRFWKQFSFGRRVETRYMERLADGSWRYATYLWSEDGRDARLVPAPDNALVPLADGAVHELPRESDCRACHESRRSPVLGFGALQLSPDRDPDAPHREAPLEGDLDLPALVTRGLLSGLPERLLREPPRIPAASARERAALGYLFGNCSGCHNAQSPIAALGLDFDVRVGRGRGEAPRALDTAVGRQSRFLIPDATESTRIAPGHADASVVAFRMGSRFAAWQMPPLGTRVVDDEALELVRSWITRDLARLAHQEGERP